LRFHDLTNYPIAELIYNPLNINALVKDERQLRNLANEQRIGRAWINPPTILELPDGTKIVETGESRIYILDQAGITHVNAFKMSGYSKEEAMAHLAIDNAGASNGYFARANESYWLFRSWFFYAGNNLGEAIANTSLPYQITPKYALRNLIYPGWLISHSRLTQEWMERLGPRRENWQAVAKERAQLVGMKQYALGSLARPFIPAAAEHMFTSQPEADDVKGFDRLLQRFIDEEMADLPLETFDDVMRTSISQEIVGRVERLADSAARHAKDNDLDTARRYAATADELSQSGWLDTNDAKTAARHLRGLDFPDRK